MNWRLQPVFHYFGYGSNMNVASLRAKGVEPLSSTIATLPGWRLVFNVRHFFRHEGGVANIVGDEGHRVAGVVHQCDDAALRLLDAAEAYGHGYDRIEVEAVTAAGAVIAAIAYIGLPAFLDDSCRPSRRYLNIVSAGAEQSGIDPDYVALLRAQPVHPKPEYPPFVFPSQPDAVYDAAMLAAHPHLTALAGAVFDMSAARPQHEYLKGFFGGRDMTLFHLKRMDSSDGSESQADIAADRLDDAQRRYLNEYLHEYHAEYRFAGRFIQS